MDDWVIDAKWKIIPPTMEHPCEEAASQVCEETSLMRNFDFNYILNIYRYKIINEIVVFTSSQCNKTLQMSHTVTWLQWTRTLKLGGHSIRIRRGWAKERHFLWIDTIQIEFHVEYILYKKINKQKNSRSLWKFFVITLWGTLLKS